MISKEIQNAFPTLRKSEQKAARYMIEHPERMEKITLEELAKRADVSPPTVMRLLKAVGYQSFKEVKVAFIEERLQKENEDQRTLGELFFFLVNEMADITFQRSISILWDALLASLQELLKLSDEQLMTFTADFMSRLPEYLRNALHPQTVMA